MTERELIQQQQELGDSRFLVTRSGKFFGAPDKPCGGLCRC